MIKLRIDNIDVSVKEGTPVMRAAESAGISIPSMCFMEGFTNHPACMVCLVKDKKSGKLFASCAMPASEGMELITSDEEVKEARKEALELLLSDHVGDCEAPCRNGCPAFMDIPLMNRLIAEGRNREALVIVKEEIALPLILGYICEAPCEKVCRRAPIDEAVSICQLKKFVAAKDLDSAKPYQPKKEKDSGKTVAIVGAGPAGLSAAFYLLRLGHKVKIFDANKEAGGSLLSIDESVLPAKERIKEIKYLESFGLEFNLGVKIDAAYLDAELKPKNDVVLFASGELLDENNKRLGLLYDAKGFMVSKGSAETSVPGIFACGSAVRRQKMAIRTVAQGKETARAIHKYLNGESIKMDGKMFNSRFGKLKEEEFAEYLKEASDDGRVFPEEGGVASFRDDESKTEADRCLHCDCRKPESCKLRIYSHEYGADRTKYLGPERKTLSKHFNHDNIIYEPEKCIKCGLCVEITMSEKELTGLSFVGRGFDVKVDVPFNRNIQSALTKTAAKCAKYCPTGAISLKEGERNGKIEIDNSI